MNKLLMFVRLSAAEKSARIVLPEPRKQTDGSTNKRGRRPDLEACSASWLFHASVRPSGAVFLSRMYA